MAGFMPDLAMPDLSAVFAADGPLAHAIPGYRLRPQQLEMAERIAAAIAGNIAKKLGTTGYDPSAEALEIEQIIRAGG